MRSPKARPTALAALVGLTLALRSGGHASAADADATERVRRADRLFGEGRAAMERNDLASACPKLAESYALDPGTGALIALALCHERSGRIASAHAAYGAARDRARQEGHAERVSVTEERLATLAPRLPSVTLRLEPGLAARSDVTLAEDGHPLDLATLGRPRAVDPGSHRVRVDVPGLASIVRDYEAHERDRLLLTLASPDGATSSGGPNGSRRLGTLGVTGLVVGAAGLVGLGVGAGFAARATSKNADSMADCDVANVCGPSGKPLRLEALHAADVATALVVAGGALAVTGGALLTASLIEINDQPATALRVEPLVGPGFAGARVGGVF